MFDLSAQALLERIHEDAPQFKGEVRTLGNGEVVCRLNNGRYVWDEEDWETYRVSCQKRDQQPH